MATKNQQSPITVYIAGDLWTHKDLIGNALLGEYIDKVSRRRYQCVLPQDLEVPVNRDVDIRNADLKHVLTSDMAVFNFDGTDLDSGTVVEFMYAKMLDIPCVILRTDFRSSGEGNKDQDPWNLMATHWPRTKVLRLNGMAEYLNARNVDSLRRTIDKCYRKMAGEIVACLDAVRQESQLMPQHLVSTLYGWAVTMPSSGYSSQFGPGELQKLIAAKQQKGLL